MTLRRFRRDDSIGRHSRGAGVLRGQVKRSGGSKAWAQRSPFRFNRPEDKPNTSTGTRRQ